MKPLVNPDDPQAPARLIRALKALQPERVFISPVIDQAILRQARRRLEAKPQRRARYWPAWLPWAAVAASICLVVVVGWLATPRMQSGVASVPEDINKDGQVDILDAFQVARELENGKLPGNYDVDKDGVVDAADVEFIARHVVRLDNGGAL